MPFAAHRCTLYWISGNFGAAGDATALVSGTTYRITVNRGINAVFVPGQSPTVYDGGVSIGTAFTADYLSGLITLDSAPAGAVTVDYTYLNLNPAFEVKEFTINLSRDELEDTVMGDTNKTFVMGLRGGGGTVGTLSLLSEFLVNSGGQQRSIESIHLNENQFVMEVVLDPVSLRSFRCFAHIPSLDVSGARDGLIEGNFAYTMSEVIAPRSPTEKASYTFFNRVP